MLVRYWAERSLKRSPQPMAVSWDLPLPFQFLQKKRVSFSPDGADICCCAWASALTIGLLLCQGRMIFSSGFIHGDPHPGCGPQSNCGTQRPKTQWTQWHSGTSLFLKVERWLSLIVDRHNWMKLHPAHPVPSHSIGRWLNSFVSSGSWLQRPKTGVASMH